MKNKAKRIANYEEIGTCYSIHICDGKSEYVNTTQCYMVEQHARVAFENAKDYAKWGIIRKNECWSIGFGDSVLIDRF